jgi:hypothetical protein
MPSLRPKFLTIMKKKRFIGTALSSPFYYYFYYRAIRKYFYELYFVKPKRKNDIQDVLFAEEYLPSIQNEKGKIRKRVSVLLFGDVQRVRNICKNISKKLLN